MADPLKAMGLQRIKEAAAEVSVPMIGAILGWVVANRVLGGPSVGRPFSPLELAAVLGAASALTGWAISRQIFMLRRRRPWVLMLYAIAAVSLGVAILPRTSKGRFVEWCGENVGGTLIETTPLVTGEAPETVCSIGGVPGNPYLPGVVVRPRWNGKPGAALWLLALGIGAVAALAYRDRRLFPTKMTSRVQSELVLAPAAGTESASQDPEPDPRHVQACANATLWGETCSQIYALSKTFEPGETCTRCYQTFRRADRELQFRVVTLYSGEVDMLNGVERMDTVSWNRGEPMPPDARISGRERWVTLGDITVPDVLTVAQTLALVHQLIPDWAGDDDPRIAEAAELAQERSSRVSCWIWTGPVAHRLTFATPTRDVTLAVGTRRLRDLVAHTGDELTLQLDIGVLPIELRVGFRRTFLEEGREPQTQNSKVDMWIPVSPPKQIGGAQGVWVPRVEGEALRIWLSTERIRPAEERGASVPLPYQVYDPERDESADPRVPRPGSLDLVRMPLERDRHEPLIQRRIGASIAEWEWLEWEQIQLLRRECLVLVDSRDGRLR